MDWDYVEAFLSTLNKQRSFSKWVSNYFNLWADHKRSKFEKIIFKKNSGEFLPIEINIFFDGRIFKLEQN